MNCVILLGRLTRDPDVRYGADSQMAVAKFSIAVDRKTKKKEADFISCVAFSKTAEVIEKYFHKGNKIAITGHIQTGQYINKDSVKVYTTDVVVDSLDFVDKRENNTPDETDKAAANEAPVGGFDQIPLDDIPF